MIFILLCPPDAPTPPTARVLPPNLDAMQRARELEREKSGAAIDDAGGDVRGRACGSGSGGGGNIGTKGKGTQVKLRSKL
jgi:hypothetical protein